MRGEEGINEGFTTTCNLLFGCDNFCKKMININGIDFEKVDGCRYKTDYYALVEKIGSGEWGKESALRSVILSDLWFIVYFVMGIKAANHPFVVKMCRIVEDGPKSRTLDVWARGHFKSSIITIAETLQYQLSNPEKCTGLLAYARPVAKAFLRSIKVLCEQSELLKACFPDVLWNNPQAESPKWSEDDGLIFKRKGAARKESSIEAWGLIEGMPTGRHFERLVFDDIETDDIRDSGEMLEKVYSKFQMAENLGTGSKDDIVRVIGTYYSHFGPMVKIGEMVYSNNEPIYKLRKVAGSDDGTADGNPILFSEETWNVTKMGEHFFSQQLCDPTPRGERRLNSSYLQDIDYQFIPHETIRFMVIDPAGDNKSGKGDSWAIHVCAVEPKTDDIGMSAVYIIDSVIMPMSNSEAIDIIVRMYLSNGMIHKLGIEKASSMVLIDEFVVKALRERGRHISEEAGNLVLLRPAGREKKARINRALEWPLNNSKLFLSKNIKSTYRDRLRMEMDKYPSGHDDGLDALAYLYDMMRDYKFMRNFDNKPLKYAELGIV